MHVGCPLPGVHVGCPLPGVHVGCPLPGVHDDGIVVVLPLPAVYSAFTGHLQHAFFGQVAQEERQGVELDASSSRDYLKIRL